MKVALLNPPQLFTKSQVTAGVFPPMGIAYLAAYLRDDYEVSVLDALGESPDTYTHHHGNIYVRGLGEPAILKWLRQEKPDVLGISNLYSFAYPFVDELAGKAKQELDIPIIVGGAHPSAMPKETMQSQNFDYVAISEGEEGAKAILKHLDRGSSLKKTGAIAYKEGKRTTINPRKDFIKDLDSLPFPARDLLPMENYFKAKEAHGSVREERWTPVISSRGCPFECTFCPTANLWGRCWRGRSAANVVDEVEECIERWGIREIHFNDENMTASKKRVQEICNEITGRGLDIIWQTPNGVRVDQLDRDTFALMKKSGCYHLTLAPESGSPATLKNIIHKSIDLRQIARATKWCSELDINTAAYFVIGLPGEKTSELIKSLSFAVRLGILGLDEIVVSVFSPLPGSKLGSDLLEKDPHLYDNLENLITMGDLLQSESWNENISGGALRLYRLFSYGFFHSFKMVFRPGDTVHMLANVFRGIQETKTERTFHNILHNIKL